MDQSVRAENGWLHGALWLVAAAFAAFLVGIGGKLSDFLVDGGTPLTLQQFIDAGPSSTKSEPIKVAYRVLSVAFTARSVRMTG